MADQFIGQLMAAGFSFAPKSWVLCNGQSLPINQNQALFALLGTIFGGDGRTNFNLPNLQGSIPLSSGSNYVLAQTGGQASVIIGIESSASPRPHGSGVKQCRFSESTCEQRARFQRRDVRLGPDSHHAHEFQCRGSRGRERPP
jgi:microcystin-dependent protein